MIVRFVAIDVVNDLVSTKPTSELPFRNKAVSVHVPVRMGVGMVGREQPRPTSLP